MDGWEKLPKVRKERWGLYSTESKFNYEPDIADRICTIIATTPYRICDILDSHEDFPSKFVFYRWLAESKEMQEKYQKAKEFQQELLVESQRDEVEWARKYTYLDKLGNKRIDGSAVSLAKLSCDTIRWNAAKYCPKKFGSKNNDDLDENRKKSEHLKELSELINKYERDY